LLIRFDWRKGGEIIGEKAENEERMEKVKKKENVEEN